MNHIRFDEPGILPCVILGAGAAGHAAAVWLDSYKVPFVWIARGAVGGMLRRVYNKLVNVPGQNFAHGPAISDGIEAQIEASKFDPPRALAIEKITREQEHFVLRADTGEELHARVVILATGTEYRTLDVPGSSQSDLVFNEDSAIISYSASRDGERLSGKEVAVVGGGDAAFENALILAKHDCKVHLLLRSLPSARRAFVGKVKAIEGITIHQVPTVVEKVEQQTPEMLRLHLSHGDESPNSTLEVEGMVIRIGVKPTYPELGFDVERDASGYIHVDSEQSTSVPRLLAVGDVTSHKLRAIVCAASSGATAALTAAELLGAFRFDEDEI